MNVQLNSKSGQAAMGAFYQLNEARRLASTVASTDKPAPDSPQDVVTRDLVSVPGTGVYEGHVTFSPQKPVHAYTGGDHPQLNYDSGPVTVEASRSNANAFNPLSWFGPATHTHYSFSSEKGDHLYSRTGLSTLTVDVSPSGDWKVQQGILSVPSGPSLKLGRFDDKYVRIAELNNTEVYPG